MFQFSLCCYIAKFRISFFITGLLIWYSDLALYLHDSCFISSYYNFLFSDCIYTSMENNRVKVRDLNDFLAKLTISICNLVTKSIFILSNFAKVSEKRIYDKNILWIYSDITYCYSHTFFLFTAWAYFLLSKNVIGLVFRITQGLYTIIIIIIIIILSTTLARSEVDLFFILVNSFQLLALVIRNFILRDSWILLCLIWL